MPRFIRRPWRFTLRTLLVAVVVVAAALAWARRQAQPYRGQAAARRVIEEDLWGLTLAVPADVPFWVRPFLSERECQDVIKVDLGGTDVRDHELEVLTHFPRLEYLDLSSTACTAEGLDVLERLPRLERLDLSVSDCGDGALDWVRRCPSLRYIRVSASSVSQRAFAQLLEDEPQLQEVFVRGDPLEESP